MPITFFLNILIVNEKRGNKQYLLDTPRRVTVIGMCLQVFMKFHQLLFKILRNLSIQKPLRITTIILAPSPYFLLKVFAMYI